MTVPLLWVLAAVSVVEASAVHIVLSARHPIAAWLVTFVSAAGAIWCGLTARSLASRPLVLTSDRLLLRAGSLWSADVPVDAIAEVRPPRRRPDKHVPGYVGLVLLGAPTVIVKLNRSIAARGPAGVTRAGTVFGVAPDDTDAFIAAVALKIAAGRQTPHRAPS